MVEHNNAIPNAVPVEEAMLLLATALEGQLEESDRPRLEQALLEHPSLRAAAADMALAPAGVMLGRQQGKRPSGP